MASSQNMICGLDINKTGICYARANPDDRTIVNVCIQPIDTEADDYWQAVAAGFDDMPREYRIPGENTVSALSGGHAVIKKIIVEADETDIPDTIAWELSQQIVGSIDEYTYDYEALPSPAAAGLNAYLVVGYRTNTVTRISRLLRAKKLNPIIIDLDIFALINVYEMNYPDQISSPALIVFSDDRETQLILSRQGTFVDMEVLAHTADMNAPEAFSDAVNRAGARLCSCNEGFENYGAVRKYITGPFFAQPGSVEQAEKNLKNAEMLFPFRQIKCTAGMDDSKIREFAPLLAVSVGLAMRGLE